METTFRPEVPEQGGNPQFSLTEAQQYLDVIDDAIGPRAFNPEISNGVHQQLGIIFTDEKGRDNSPDAALTTLDALIDGVRRNPNLRAAERDQTIRYYRALQNGIIMPDEARREDALFRRRLEESDTGEHREMPVANQSNEALERLFASDVVDDIVGHYRQATQIRTDTLGGSGMQTYGNDNLDNSRFGVTSLWSRLALESLPGLQDETDVTNLPVEVAAFTPATEPVYKEEVTPAQPGTWFTKGVPESRRRVATGEHRRMVTKNELDDRAEPAVYVDYTFNPTGPANRLALEGQMPEYRELGGGRLGNSATVRLKLPESVATRLREYAEKDPSVMRELLDKVVLAASDGRAMNEELWYQAQGNNGRGRPPFEELPRGWKLFIIEPAGPDDPPIKDNGRNPFRTAHTMRAIPFNNVTE